MVQKKDSDVGKLHHSHAHGWPCIFDAVIFYSSRTRVHNAMPRQRTGAAFVGFFEIRIFRPINKHEPIQTQVTFQAMCQPRYLPPLSKVLTQMWTYDTNLTRQNKVDQAEPWSSDYGRRLVFQRSWVRIPALYTGWSQHFFAYICCKNCSVCLKSRK